MPSAAARKVAAVLPPDKRQQLPVAPGESRKRLERRQRRRAFDELGRGGELDLAAAVHIAGEVAERRQAGALGEIPAHAR